MEKKMSGAPDKPQDKTNGRGGREYLLNNRDLIVIAASAFIVFLAMIVYNSLKGNNISCVYCNDTGESKVHCKGLKKIDLLEERIEELTKELKDTKQSIKEQDGVKPVLFDIKLQVNQQVFASGATIKFNHPVINTGNVYRTDLGMSGIFEPPVNGVYSFTATVCTFPYTWMLFGLIKDGTVLDEVMVGDSDWHACGTSTTNTYVTTANKVWVKVLQTNRGVLNSGLGVSSFKGILLSTSKP